MGDSSVLDAFGSKDKDVDSDLDLVPNGTNGDAMLSVAHNDPYGHQVEINYVVEAGLARNVPVFSNSESHHGPIPVQATGSRSIEIFFGKFTTFQSFYQVLCDHGTCVAAPPESEQPDPNSTKVKPESIRKLVLVGHPINSFSGLNKFVKLSEAWITHCDIKEAKWSDFAGLNNLHRLYMFNCNLERLEPLHFPNLKSLWISGNKLPSLSFLGQGLPSLLTLNVAKNDITCLQDEQLFKCVNLHTLNLSGNPICTVQDVQAVKVLSSLQTLFLADPIYGKCPVAALCDSRTMLLSILTGLSSLDGKSVSVSELGTIQEYVSTRALFYYANSVRSVASQVMNRRTIVISSNKKLEMIGKRILDLIALAARYRRVLSSVDVVPIFTNAKNLLKDQLMKIEDRVNKLKEWVAVTLRRREIIMLISRWEQEAEKWMKWIEFRSFGNTQCHIIHSVHGSVLNDSNFLFTCLHQLMSALSCPGLWPPSMMLKIETIVVLKDIGMEIGLQRTYDENYAGNNEPAFVAPQESTGSLVQNTSGSNAFVAQQYPFYSFPGMPPKPVTTYLSPDYVPPEPIFPFPESVAGLQERAQPVFMFLICPPSAASNPLVFLHRILTEKSRHYKDIRVTNCLWYAINRTKNFSVVVIVKVLMESMQAVQVDKRGCTHSWDCSVFSLKKPLAFTPAYLVNISFTPDDKHCFWQKWTTNDSDVIGPAENALLNLAGKITAHGHPNTSKLGGTKKSPFVRKVGEGVVADLSCSELFINRDGTIHCGTPIPDGCTSQSLFDVQQVSKFLGNEVSQVLTSLDLSGNNLSLLIGLEGLTTLKKLNLCHNKLTTIASLSKLPNLIELRLGWNSLRFFLSTSLVLQQSVPRLMTLEILPNPFQDIRDPSHIPIILKRAFAVLHRVDIWISPFQSPPSLFCKKLYSVADCGFSHVGMVKSWVGTALSYNDLASKCLIDLESLPVTPPFPEGFGSNGMDLNLSDNYLSSIAIAASHFVHSTQWRTCLVKLQLQENSISNLDWMKDTAFPNIQILNVSNNRLTEIQHIANACPSLRHLALASNPLPRDVNLVLSPIRPLENLNTLDCTACPLSGHPEYGIFVSKHLPSVKILDGIPMKDWGMSDSVESVGGVLTGDWLEERLGNKNWSALTQLSLPNSNLQKISLPPHCLPKLMTLDLADNFLTSLTSLSSLPSLRVLCVSHNSISALGSAPCPTCFAQTAQSQAMNALKAKNPNLNGILTSDSFGKGLPWGVKSASSTVLTLNGSQQYSPPVSSDGASVSRKCPPKPLFPKLEVLILSHNGLSSISDLHLHSMPQLQTIMLNCNNLTSLQGLENLPTVKAIVLDHNRVTDVPHNSLTGCKSLKYLHLEHNRITAIPRLPHLTNLVALHLSHNKIQNLTDMAALAQNTLTELSMQENPISAKCAFRLRVAARLPQLGILDGKELNVERVKLQDLSKKWYPGSGLSVRDHAIKDPVQCESRRSSQDSRSDSISRQQQRSGSEFTLGVSSPQSAKSSQRATQFNNMTGYGTGKRNNR